MKAIFPAICAALLLAATAPAAATQAKASDFGAAQSHGAADSRVRAHEAQRQFGGNDRIGEIGRAGGAASTKPFGARGVSKAERSAGRSTSTAPRGPMGWSTKRIEPQLKR